MPIKFLVLGGSRLFLEREGGVEVPILIFMGARIFLSEEQPCVLAPARKTCPNDINSMIASSHRHVPHFDPACWTSGLVHQA